MKALGSCNCGRVQFEIASPISDVYVCHCSICRKSTGSGGIAVTIVSNSDFSWLEGNEFIKTWQNPDHDWQTSFCKTCGSVLPGKNDDQATYIPVSLLNSGYQQLRVRHHLFVDSKAPWEEIGDDAIQHKQNFKAKESQNT